jgi:hypothetical protein
MQTSREKTFEMTMARADLRRIAPGAIVAR